MDLLKYVKPLSSTAMVFLAALVVGVFHNFTFLKKVVQAFPGQTLFQISVFLVLVLTLFIVFTILAQGRFHRGVLLFLILFSAMHAYFTDRFSVIGDETMILNIQKTNFDEASDLLSLTMVVYLFLLGILPTLVLSRLPQKPIENWSKQLLSKIRDISVSVLLILLIMLGFGKTYASFLREYKPIRYYANPIYFMYSSIRYVQNKWPTGPQGLAAVGADAKISQNDKERDLVIFVLGETARADRFSINGYQRETNPLLKNEDIITFQDVVSCGTSTATSVPCLFSIFGRSAFDHAKADHTENLVDVLLHTGEIAVLWRDNNSNSKGVATRAQYEDYKTSKHNTICDEECRDEGMLVGLQEYIESRKEKDIFIVLHQMGNHGPAYYKRYPKEFEKFQPVCRDTDLGKCSNEEINNAYDNAILYTDYFLSKVIQLLKKNSNKFETAMFYLSDHGESLGENGIYLHGLPYAISPIEQRRVPLVIWFGDSMKHDINFDVVKSNTSLSMSHDNVFHMLLGLFEVQSAIYDPKKDVLRSSRRDNIQ